MYGVRFRRLPGIAWKAFDRMQRVVAVLTQHSRYDAGLEVYRSGQSGDAVDVAARRVGGPGERLRDPTGVDLYGFREITAAINRLRRC